MTESKIKNIEFLDNYQIKICLKNEHCIIYNMKPRLDTARFQDLCNPSLFFRGRLVKGHIIQWDYAIELSLEEILNQISENYRDHQRYPPEKQKG